MGETETEPIRPKVTDAKGILQQNREFLDFFWDIAKPDQETRLKAIENLIQYLKNSEKPDELKYTLKRLVDGLSHTREAARPGFSLALAQVLQVFEELPLQTALEHIKEKHDLQRVKKVSESTVTDLALGCTAVRKGLLVEPKVVLECVQLLQSLAQYREHLKDLPRKTMVDILSETPEEVFEDVLLGALQSDLSSAFSTPEQLHLLLVAIQKFPGVLKPKKLKKLLGTTTVVTTDNIPKLIEVLKMAAKSVKKDQSLPSVGLDLLQVALREDNFDLFWREAVVKGLLLDQSGPCSYMCYRLLGSALPLLSLQQIRYVLSGEVMRHYGEHVLTAQLPDRFKFAPEMQNYVGAFLQACSDPDKQMAVMVGFSTLTNQGYPVVPSFWKVVEHLTVPVLHSYVEWLKAMFTHPQLDSCLDFSTKRQQQNQETEDTTQHRLFRLRKWIVPRLCSIVENVSVKKEEDLVMDIARFIFFHAFFDAKKSTPDIPETESALTLSIDDQTRNVLSNAFFGLTRLPVLGDAPDTSAQKQRHVLGVTADGTLWIFCLVQYADVLLSQTKYVRHVAPFTAEQRAAWDRMLATVEKMTRKAKKTESTDTFVFQQLFLLVGIQLFKAPEESVELIQDLHNCLEKAQEKTTTKKKKPAGVKGDEDEEPQWVEVVVDILLSLLSQPSRLIRQVCRTVFTGICPQVNQRALKAILDVLDPEKDEEESAVVVTDDKDSAKKSRKDRKTGEEDDDEDDEEEEESDSSEDDSGEEGEDEEEEEEEEEEPNVDENFRMELMKVLQGQNALATEGDESEDDDVDDETMMKLDDSISALFSEQKKRIQAKKDEKEKLRKEKALVRDFKIKVLDLVEVFLNKQPDSPLVFGIVEPLLGIIEGRMSSEANQQEQDFLRKTADIFRNQLCKAKRYCKSVEGMQAELHDMLERLLTRAQRQPDSSVSLYYFSAALYLVRVLKGNLSSSPDPAAGKSKAAAKPDAPAAEQALAPGLLDVERVAALFQAALAAFMTKRKSSLSGALFLDLFSRFPILSVRLLDGAVKHMMDGVRSHQQGQACALVLRAMQTREVRQSMTDSEWAELLGRVVHQVTESLKAMTGIKVKVDQEKVVKSLELGQFLVRTVQKQKLPVSLAQLQLALHPLSQMAGFRKTGHLEDTYWSVMKLLGVTKPKVEKVRKAEAEPATPKKKKGFLPETKKRKNRKKAPVPEVKGEPLKESGENGEKEGGQGKKKRNKNKNKNKRKQGFGEAGPGQAPAKKPKLQAAGKQKKTKRKLGGE
ncbi:MBB1A protein, partial [Amia calva]|nr:MBB1A protein [Amia calva]